MRKFQIGDILIGNEWNDYNITNREWKCKVIQYIGDKDTSQYDENCDKYDIEVKMIEGPYQHNTYEVTSWKFNLVEPAISKLDMDDWLALME